MSENRHYFSMYTMNVRNPLQTAEAQSLSVVIPPMLIGKKNLGFLFVFSDRPMIMKLPNFTPTPWYSLSLFIKTRS